MLQSYNNPGKPSVYCYKTTGRLTNLTVFDALSDFFYAFG